MEEAKHKMYKLSNDISPSMRYLMIPPPQNKYLIINILKNTLMTHLTSFKNTLSKQRLNL